MHLVGGCCGPQGERGEVLELVPGREEAAAGLETGEAGVWLCQSINIIIDCVLGFGQGAIQSEARLSAQDNKGCSSSSSFASSRKKIFLIGN